MAVDHDGTTADREWLINQIAHALRNPIFAASVQAEALLMRAANQDAVVKTAEALRGQLDRLSKSIDEMLLYGRPMRPNLALVNVAELLESAVQRCRSGASGELPTVDIVEVDPVLKCRSDRNAVLVILERLLDNAIQHTEAPHEVRLRARQSTAGEVEITVEDDGEGIAPELLDQVTLPFFPQHSGRPGLGLAVADKFVRILGGRLEIESTDGRGTVVRCILPQPAEDAGDR
jgi:signal transduction histidine kinase